MNKQNDQVVFAGSCGTMTEFGSAQVWHSKNYSELWFRDACQVAGIDSLDGRRHEIIFSVACVESYLVEWVLQFGVDELERQNSIIFKKGIKDRWKEVLKALKNSGKLESLPDFKSGCWSCFVKYIDYRNDLLHGNASRPYNNENKNSALTLRELESLKPGEVVRSVFDLIEELAEVTKKQAPSWLSRI